MDLKEHLKYIGCTQRDFSKKLGIHYMYLSAIIRGLRRPSPDLALKIEKATGGMVKKEDLLWPDKGAA